MKLFKQKIEYNTLELIESCIDLSKNHFANDDRKSLLVLDNMVTINLGRRTGHTEAIRKHMLDYKPQNVFVVVPKEHMGKELYGRFGVNYITAPKFNNRGVSIDSKLLCVSDVGIIFDTCSQNDIQNFFSNVAPYIRNIKFIVNVAPV